MTYTTSKRCGTGMPPSSCVGSGDCKLKSKYVIDLTVSAHSAHRRPWRA